MSIPVIVIEGLCCLISLCLCGYRFYLRLFVARGDVWIEVTLFIALILQIGLYATSVKLLELPLRTPEDVISFGKYWEAGAPLYLSGLWAVKLSINLLHVRVTERFPGLNAWAVRSVYFMIFSWVYVVVTQVCSCLPLRRRWDGLVGKAPACKPVAQSWDFWTHVSLHILTDIWLIVLPFPALRQLRTRPQLRIAIFLVYSLAFSSVIVTIVRAILLSLNSQDNNKAVNLLSMIELTTVLVVATIPTISSGFMKRFRRGGGEGSHVLGNVAQKGSSRSRTRSNRNTGPFERIGDGFKEDDIERSGGSGSAIASRTETGTRTDGSVEFLEVVADENCDEAELVARLDGKSPVVHAR